MVLLLCLVMVSMILIGCAGQNATITSGPTVAVTETAAAATTAQATTTPAADPYGKYDPPITITMSTIVNAQASYDENDPEKKSVSENRWINAYLDKLGIKIVFKWISPDGDSDTTKWNTAIASGSIPDVAIMTNGSVYQSLVEGGLCADMTQIFDQYADPEYIKKIVTDDVKRQMMFDGVLRGIAMPGAGYYSTLLYVRQDWLDKLNLKAPTTIDEVILTAKAFQEAKLGGNDTIGILFSDSNGNSTGRWDGFFNAYGAYLNYWVKTDNGLAYSELQPAMKDALLSMQSIYEQGIMNKDFATVTEDLAQEYVSSGKVGILYAKSWLDSTALTALYENDPNAKFIHLFPPSKTSDPIPEQTSTPISRKIFVSATCEYPEAAVKMMNLTVKLYMEDYYNYGIGQDGYLWFKQIPFNGTWFGSDTLCDVGYANEIREAEKTGVRNFSNKSAEGYYENYLQAKQGNAPKWWLEIFGEGGSYTMNYDSYKAGLLLENAFVGLPTKTMQLKGDIINSALTTAELDVIMGKDISEYENAVSAWLANGGQQITDEVNDWYKSSSK